jgi:response regulator RpfG family c-di-GMP phosphodiesterase
VNNLKIISVDDTYMNLIIIEEMAKDMGIEVISFQNPLDALEYIKNERVDMMLADYMMPKLNGLELIRKALIIQEELIPIMVTAVSENAELKLAALNIGAADFLTKPIDLAQFKAKIKNFYKMIQLKLKLKDFNRNLQEEVKKATTDLLHREQEALSVISRLAEYRDPETGSHIARVAHYSKLLAKEYGLDESEQEIIFFASPLHDVGKVGIRDDILLKPGKLEANEYEIMKTHSSIGYDILKESQNPYLIAGAIIAKLHHEKYDGSGYYSGISGDEIHIYGRITAIADVFDALTSERPYKKPWTFEEAVEFLKKESGKHFDPKLVELFIKNIDMIKEIYEKFEK